MIENIPIFIQIIKELPDYFDDSEDSNKINPAADKWSKKEILGHLIDSAINNLQRFTEVKYAVLPYTIRKYDQVNLVKANNYNDGLTEDLIQLWTYLNKRILTIVSNYSTQQLAFNIILPNGENNNIEFLATDYIDHLNHHFQQIKQLDNL
jgi:hypothetical protein